MFFNGFLPEKTVAKVDGKAVQYMLNDASLNALIGQSVSFSFTGKTQCIGCGAHDVELTDGHCETCRATLAKCDTCKVKPELCHYAAGTCREPQWGEENCLTAHTIYLSNTSGVKVGITRDKNIAERTRWIDQGATQALPILRVSDRLTSGQIEVMITEVMADKTNWRKMLAGDNESLDLKAIAAQIIEQFKDKLALYGDRVLEVLDAEVVELSYPVQKFPAKVGNPWNVSKQPVLSGVLTGIKGQYVMVDVDGKVEVLSLRKYAGYEVKISVKNSV